MEFGNLFNGCEPKLCNNNSNKVKRRMRQKLHTAAGMPNWAWASQFDFSSSQIPYPLGACAWCPADTHERLHEITIVVTTVGLAQAHPNKSGHWHCPGLTSNVCHFDLQANGAFNGFTFPNSLLRWPSTANHSNQLLYAMVKVLYKNGDEEDCFFIRVSLYEYSAWYLTVVVGRPI